MDINIGKSIYYRLTLIIKQHFKQFSVNEMCLVRKLRGTIVNVI